MRGPLGFYINLVDGAAYDKAESGNAITQADPPFAPLLFPWVVGAPALALLPLTDDLEFVIFAATMALSVGLWCAFAFFYYRRVQHYRQEFTARPEPR